VADYYDAENMRWVKGAKDSTAIPKIESAPTPGPVCTNDKALREKALMYAVNAYGSTAEDYSVLQLAKDFHAFLRGDAA